MVAWLHIGIILRVYGKEELAQGKGDEMNDFLHLSFHRRERLQLGLLNKRSLEPMEDLGNTLK